MTWARKRQISYVSIVIGFILALGFLISYPYLNKEPTCSDGKQNGNETGVDCGGNCLRACVAELDQISILWSRAFQVVPGRYNAVAYLENKNDNTAINRISYRFRFADQDNIYIGKREGVTFIPSRGKFAIFEPAIDVGNSMPVFTTFEFTQNPAWLQVDRNKINQLKISSTEVELENADTSPRLTANLKNNSLYTIPDLSAIAILYDGNKNAVGVSKTFISELEGEETVPLTFTWPEPLISPVVYKEIIPMYNIFSVKLK